ncbi:MAG: thermonuclease family protein [Clostridia bacterium]|nr:thermonuclease family protein [Clostridia bacterium]
MKKLTKLLALLLLICTLISALAACNPGGEGGGDKTQTVDFAGDVELDMSSSSIKQEVTVKAYIDGDTTHFYVPTSVSDSGVLKARYLAINTPESTGKIEEWGKKASNFTKTKLKEAESIIIESDDGKWNADSTGDRYLVWVWYKPAGSEEYRNLNIEILQEGLAIASNSGQNRYGSICLDAIAQAKAEKLHIHSGVADPDFYYGEAVEVTLSELRANIESYEGVKVAFNGIITRDSNNGVYVEAYDAETGMYNGMYVYYGFNLSGKGLQILSVGNEVRIVGTVSYYETGDSWQVSGLQYRARVPDDPDNIQKLGEGNLPAYLETTAEKFTSTVDRVVIEDGEEVLKPFDYAKLCLATSISMDNLKVVSIYTTDNEESKNDGAMTLTCKVGSITVDVRTGVLKDAEGNVVTEDYFKGKTIDVKGIIDCFKGTYQIKVFSLNDIVIH